MDSLPPTIPGVLRNYPPDCFPATAEELVGTAGFSGARLWKLSTPRGRLVLRRSPREHPPVERLRFIHDVLHHLVAEGIEFVPVPLAASNRETFVEYDRHWWELAPWLPGVADYLKRPNEAKLVAALQALAKLHIVLARHPSAPPTAAVSLGISERQRRLTELMQGGLERIRCALNREIWPELFPLADNILTLFPLAAPRVASELNEATKLATSLQACLRDIWHEHVLFVGDRVSGIIDFGAMRIDSASTDIARLLGSMAGDDVDQWKIGIAAYEAVRPLSSAERTLVRAFDASGTLLSGCNWLEWIYVDRIEFANWVAVMERIRAIVGRLQHLARNVASEIRL